MAGLWAPCFEWCQGNAEGRHESWDAQTHEKVHNIKGHTNSVFAVDISSDSTRFATGSYDKTACIWGLTTGEQLVGPLQHEGIVVGVRFPPTGDRIAAAAAAETKEDPKAAMSIRIYNSETGQILLDIPFRLGIYSTSLAWSLDGYQLFAASYSEVKCFHTSSESLIKNCSVPGSGYVASVVLSRNQKFAVVSAYQTLSFWDCSTYQQIGTAIQHTSSVWWIALSPNDDLIATGENNGKVILRDLRDILPVSYLTVNVCD